MKQKRPRKNEKGAALLMAIFFVMITSFLAISVSYDTIVQYHVSSQAINQLRAYYAAKSGVEISLLRVLIYKKALVSLENALGDKFKGNEGLLDPIWNFPFAWPPSGFLPEGISQVDASIIQGLEKESLMKAQYVTSIEDEAGKIDINDLGSSSETIRKATKKQILKIFELELERNDDFSDKYGNSEFEKLVNNIQDWVDDDDSSENGGDEKGNYQDLRRRFGNSNIDNFPPNSAFRSIEELHMVAGMKDDFFNLLKDRVTIYGVKGINVNSADAKVLASLDTEMTKEVIAAVLDRRDNPEKGGPFKGEDDFLSFLEGENVSTEEFNEDGIPLLFGTEHNFVIKSSGTYGNVVKEITAITYDLDALKGRLLTILEEEDKEKSGENEDDKKDDSSSDSGQGQDSADSKSQKNKTSAQKKIPKGRPTIVFWEEN